MLSLSKCDNDTYQIFSDGSTASPVETEQTSASPEVEYTTETKVSTEPWGVCDNRQL